MTVSEQGKRGPAHDRIPIAPQQGGPAASKEVSAGMVGARSRLAPTFSCKGFNGNCSAPIFVNSPASCHARCTAASAHPAPLEVADLGPSPERDQDQEDPGVECQRNFPEGCIAAGKANARRGQRQP